MTRLQPLTRIDAYLARLIFVPMMSTLVIAAMLLLLDKMLKLFDFVVHEGGPVSVVWRMLGNLFPSYLAQGIPIGLFLGVLLAFRKLALNSELDSMIGSGISFGRLLRVPMIFAIILLLSNVLLVGFIQPIARTSYERLVYDLRSGAFGASIKVGEFVKFGKKLTLRIDESREQGQALHGIFVHVDNPHGEEIVINAERGTFLATADPDRILFRLLNGVLIQTRPGEQPRQLTFVQHDLPIDLPKIEAMRASLAREAEMTLPQLIRASASPTISPTLQQRTSANLYRRLAQSFIMLFVPFLALAYAIPPKRSTSSMGIFAGIVLLATFNKISEAMERLSGRGEAQAFAVQAIPMLIFGLFCFWNYRQLAYVVAGQPLGGVDHLVRLVSNQLNLVLRPLVRRIGFVKLAARS